MTPTPPGTTSAPESVGLTDAEARQRLVREGPNELPASRQRGVLRLIREVASEPMFLLLVACGAIYMLLGDRQEALMLLGFVFVVMGISFSQQRRSEKSLDALRDLSSPRALVERDGKALRIAARELVVGDTVLLAEGDRVPADIRLVQVSNLAVDESLLTGESAPVTKTCVSEAPDLGQKEDASEGSRLAFAFSGTLVTRCGRVRCARRSPQRGRAPFPVRKESAFLALRTLCIRLHSSWTRVRYM